MDKVDATCSDLTPGETLCLGTVGEDCRTTYVVRPNDTCELVSSMANINSTILYYNNPQLNQACTNMYVGEVRTFLCTLGFLLPYFLHNALIIINFYSDDVTYFLNIGALLVTHRSGTRSA